MTTTTTTRPAANDGATPTPVSPRAGRKSRPAPTISVSTPIEDASVPVVPAQDRTAISLPAPAGAALSDPVLVLAADVLDDLERVRIANENRLRQLTRTEIDADGVERGFGLDENHPDVARLAAMVDMLAKIEHDAELNLARHMRQHPLYAWTRAQRGVGDKQVARLLAAIGDPYINSATGHPRTVSALWAYAGLHVLAVGQVDHDNHSVHADGNQLPARDQGRSDDHRTSVAGRAQTSTDQEEHVNRRRVVGGSGSGSDQDGPDAHGGFVGVAPKRRRGQRANWSAVAKMRVYLIAASCIRQISAPCHASAESGQWLAYHQDRGDCTCSPYRVVYDQRRMHTAITHPEWTDGHSHNDGIRIAGKRLLRDLWREAHRLHTSV